MSSPEKIITDCIREDGSASTIIKKLRDEGWLLVSKPEFTDEVGPGRAYGRTCTRRLHGQVDDQVVDVRKEISSLLLERSYVDTLKICDYGMSVQYLQGLGQMIGLPSGPGSL